MLLHLFAWKKSISEFLLKKKKKRSVTQTNKKLNSYHTRLVFQTLASQKERGYAFKYQNLFQACQSPVGMIQAGRLITLDAADTELYGQSRENCY